MSLLSGIVGKEAKERAETAEAKRLLEAKLNRKVEDHEIYSLSANLEAANAPRLATEKPKVRSTKKILAVVGIVLVILAIGAGGILALINRQRLAVKTTAAVPAAIFPPTIAGHNLKSSPTSGAKSNHNLFRAEYEKAGNPIYYEVLEFNSPEAAQAGFKTYQKTLPSSEQSVTLQESENRFINIGKENDQIHVVLLSGARIIDLWNYKRVKELINFENALPYSSLEIAQPTVRTADGLKVPLLESDEKIPVLTLLDDYNTDKEATAAKYHGKRRLFSAVVSDIGTAQGLPFVVVSKPGSEPSINTIVTCQFTTTDVKSIGDLKKGDKIDFVGIADVKTMPAVVIKKCVFPEK